MKRRGLFSFLCLNTLFLFISACGNDALFQKYEQAARKQDALDSQTQELFLRSPYVDSNGRIATVDQDPDRVPRTEVEITGLLSLNRPLESEELKVFQSSSRKRAPTFFEWAGRRVPWENPDFQIFMAYFHGKRAMDFYKAISTQPIEWDFLVEEQSSLNTKLAIYSNQTGSPFDTSYDFLSKEINFFSSGDGELGKYNPIDESDAIYHEVGHVAMHALRPALVTLPPGTNPDLDSIQEAISDFLAAAVTGDDSILNYFTANARMLGITDARTLNPQTRTLDNSLYFPKAYRNDIYLDARVVASALNDLRKYLIGDQVRQLSRCSGEACKIELINPALSNDEAFIKVSNLALSAFVDLVEGSTFRDFARNLNAYCSSPLFCPGSETAEVLGRILLGRGLSSELSPTLISSPTEIVWSSDLALADILVSQEIGFMEFPGDIGFSNENGAIEPCEVLLIFPKVKNNTAARSRSVALRGWQVELGGVSGFTEFKNPATNVAIERINGSGSLKPSLKFFGWMDPGETSPDSVELIRNADSIWYQEADGSFFARRISTEEFPSAVGWLVRAPSQPGGVGTARLKMTAQIDNSNQFIEISNDNPNVLEDTFIKPNGVDFPSLQVSTVPVKSFCQN